MEALTFFVALLLAFIGWYFKNYHESYKMAMKLPGPPGFPLIGNALMFLGKSPSQLLKVLEAQSKKYGRTVRFLVGPQVQVLLTDPKDAEMILGSQKLIDKSDEYEFIAHWLGTGLLISTGKKWFARRKVKTIFHLISIHFMSCFSRLLLRHSILRFWSSLWKFSTNTALFSYKI